MKQDINTATVTIAPPITAVLSEGSASVPIQAVTVAGYQDWYSKQDDYTQTWLQSSGFVAKKGQYQLLPSVSGQASKVVLIVENNLDFWSFGQLRALPAGIYHLDRDHSCPVEAVQAVLGFALGLYRFRYYYPQAETDQSGASKPCLWVEDAQTYRAVFDRINALYLGRDLINMPAEDMGPEHLAHVVADLAKQYHGKFKQVTGEKLLKENFPAIYTVGRASHRMPRLLELNWGDKNHPKLVLVGKGVCFDSGGLDLKPSAGMLLMKKDMGGAAHVLALAQMVMSANLPVNLRVLIPAVDNAVAGNAYRPGDVIATRKGKTVEITNTDAEGRLVLCDALALACEEQPDLVIDFATLTGAARVALGTELPAYFTNQSDIEQALRAQGESEVDPVWPMPLFAGYRDKLDSKIADLVNCDLGGFGGAITAALYLQEFITKDTPWVHFDVMGYNKRALPGRPEGGEIMGVRAVFAYLQEKFG